MVERYAVDWTSWQAFQLTAARHGFKPKEWLASHVAVGIQQGWTAQEVLELLFGDGTLAQAVAESIQEEPMAVTKRSRDSRKHKPAFTDIA